MLEFIIGLFAGILIMNMIASSKKKKGSSSGGGADAAPKKESGSAPEKETRSDCCGARESTRGGSESHSSSEYVSEVLEIPVEVLPNLYSVTLSNVLIEHVISRPRTGPCFNYVTLRCRVNYHLNRRREGKRKILFTSYDEYGRVLEIRGDYKDYKLTAAGVLMAEVCFDKAERNMPARISVLIQD